MIDRNDVLDAAELRDGRCASGEGILDPVDTPAQLFPAGIETRCAWRAELIASLDERPPGLGHAGCCRAQLGHGVQVVESLLLDQDGNAERGAQRGG